MDEPRPLEKVGDCNLGVIERECPQAVQRLTRLVEHGVRIFEVVELLPVECHPQRGFPSGHLTEGAPDDLELIGVQKGETRAELLSERTPLGVVEPDDRIGLVRSTLHGEGAPRRTVGVRPSVIQLEGQGTHHLGVGI